MNLCVCVRLQCLFYKYRTKDGKLKAFHRYYTQKHTHTLILKGFPIQKTNNRRVILMSCNEM